MDVVVSADRAAEHHHSHHAGAANHLPVGIASEHLLQQTGLERVDLLARIAQTGERHERVIADAEHGADRKRE